MLTSAKKTAWLKSVIEIKEDVSSQREKNVILSAYVKPGLKNAMYRYR